MCEHYLHQFNLTFSVHTLSTLSSHNINSTQTKNFIMALEIGARAVVSGSAPSIGSVASPIVAGLGAVSTVMPNNMPNSLVALSLPPPGAMPVHSSSEALQQLMAAAAASSGHHAQQAHHPLGPLGPVGANPASIEHLLNNYTAAAVAMAHKQLQQQQAEEAQHLFLRALSAAATSPETTVSHATTMSNALVGGTNPSAVFSPSSSTSSSSSISFSPSAGSAVPVAVTGEEALRLPSPLSSSSRCATPTKLSSESVLRRNSSSPPTSLGEQRANKTDTTTLNINADNNNTHLTNMGRPESISPPQPLALSSYGRFAMAMAAAAASRKSPSSGFGPNGSASSASSSPLEKLQSLSPNTIAFAANQAAVAAAAAHQARLLKFSIDNILSPEFGRNEANRNLFLSYYYQQFQEKYTNQLNLAVKQQQQAQLHHQHNLHNNHSHHQKLSSFDINTLVSNAAAAAAAGRKRKRSDSESSTISSLSTHSKEAKTTSNNPIGSKHRLSPSAAATNTSKNKLNSVGGNASINNNNLEKDIDKDAPLEEKLKEPKLWPAWVYCTRYSDRPSSGRCKIYFVICLLFSDLNVCLYLSVLYIDHLLRCSRPS